MQVLHRSYRLVASWLIGLVLVASLSPNIQAQTTTAITPTSGFGTTAPRSGNTINIQGGRQSGQNLFHSFDQFNLGAADTANFAPSSGASNVISRVTGGPKFLENGRSFIDGTLQLNNWSNFYFVNPNGIVFGPTAKLQATPGVPFSGSASFSTAHYLRFEPGGNIFSTQSGTIGTELLSSSAVSAYGFLTKIPVQPITITGSTLTVGKTLDVVGGAITIDGGQLSARNGKVQVGSVSEATGFDEVGYLYESVGDHCSGYCYKSLGYGGEIGILDKIYDRSGERVIGYTPVFSKGNVVLGSITMNPGSSFAALDAGEGGKVQTLPEPIEIQTTQSGAQKIIRPSEGTPNLVKVVTAPFLDSATQFLTIDEGATQIIRISLNKPAEIGETVVLVNTDPSSATTEPIRAVPFKKGEQTHDVKVTGLKEGTTEIRATLRNVTKSTAVTVRSPVGFQGLKGPEILDIGDRGTYRITLDRAGRKGTFIDLLRDESGVVKLLNSDPIDMEGLTFKDIVIEAVKKGETNIRAQLRNSTKIASARVRVDERLNVQTLRAPALLDEGVKDFITVKLNRPDESPVFVELLTTSSNGSVTLETKTIRIDQNADTSRPIQIIGEQAGDVRITARLQNTSVESNTTVKVQAIPIESLSPDLAIKEDQTSTLNVTLARETQRAIRIDLENSAPLVVFVDPFVTVEPGTKSATVPVVGLKDGVATIKATGRAGQDTASVQVTLLDPPPLSGVGPDLKINVRSSSNGDSIVVSLAEPFKRDVPIRLSSSDPNIATVGDITIIPAGKTSSSPVQVAGHKVGQVVITAASGTSSAQAQINVDIPTNSRQAIDLASSAQYPRIITTPPATISVPRLLAGRCAGNKDGQFSSFAQLNRDSAPPQPGRYLSSPTLLENEVVVGRQGVIPEISFMVGPPKLLTVKPESMVFTMLTENCGR